MFSQKIKLNEKQENLYIEKICTEIKTVVENKGISVDVTGRLKSINSIQDKMQLYGVTSLDKIRDIYGVRIICDDISDCYTILNIIHGKWKHIPSQFDDYIMKPKANRYRSIHGAIHYKGKNVEIQIRTHEMHEYIEKYCIQDKEIRYKEKQEKQRSEKKNKLLKIFNFFKKDDSQNKENNSQKGGLFGFFTKK